MYTTTLRQSAVRYDDNNNISSWKRKKKKATFIFLHKLLSLLQLYNTTCRKSYVRIPNFHGAYLRLPWILFLRRRPS